MGFQSLTFDIRTLPKVRNTHIRARACAPLRVRAIHTGKTPNDLRYLEPPLRVRARARLLVR